MVFVHVPCSSSGLWVLSETGCKSCPAIGAASVDHVSWFGPGVTDGYCSTGKAVTGGRGGLQLLMKNFRKMCGLIGTGLSGDI